MRTSFLMPHAEPDQTDEFCSAAAVMEIARAAEAMGFDGMAISEHPIPGLETFAFGGHNQVDPIVTLAIAAAATTRLKLQTHLLVLPYRNPFLTAKSIATLDAMSGGRVNLGVGADYGEAEFAALGVPFADRNDLTDEAITVMKLAWSGEVVRYQGSRFEAPGNVALPIPVQRPHPPIWVGGNSNRALRRAALLGDGWLPFPNPPEIAAKRRSDPLWSPKDLARKVRVIRDELEAKEDDRPIEIVFMPFQLVPGAPCPDPGATIETATRLRDGGMTYMTVAVAGPDQRKTRAGFLANMEWMAANLLPQFSEL